MDSIKIKLSAIIILLFIFYSCSEDEPNGPVQEKANFMVYGLLGVAPHWEEPDSSIFWVYARAFNHPKYQNLEAELIQGTSTIPLESDYWNTDKYFTEGKLKLSFMKDEKYEFRMRDSEKTYSGIITTLPQLEITLDTVLANQVVLEWSDINADFYDVEFFDGENFEKHYQVEDNQFTININELPFESASDIQIDIAGFKGFSPISNPNGNINGCYGYLFGYSRNGTNLNTQTKSFSRQVSETSLPNLDKLILSLYKNSAASGERASEAVIKFKFTFGSIYNSGYSQSGWNYFYGVTLVEPANSLDIFEGYINDNELDAINWNGFYNILRSWDRVYETYDKTTQFKFRLNINNQLDSAYVTNPDSFSILSHSEFNLIPDAPFEIRWRRPDNADFFLIDASWEVKGDSLAKNYLYITENNSYSISDIPDSVVSGQIVITAVNGANPMRTLEPNLKYLNGYFYSKRICHDWLHFSDNKLKKGLSSDTYTAKQYAGELNKRMDHFMISKLSEKHPKLENYNFNVLNQMALE